MIAGIQAIPTEWLSSLRLSMPVFPGTRVPGFHISPPRGCVDMRFLILYLTDSSIHFRYASLPSSMTRTTHSGIS
jgi:hypothetical protein